MEWSDCVNKRRLDGPAASSRHYGGDRTKTNLHKITMNRKKWIQATHLHTARLLCAQWALKFHKALNVVRSVLSRCEVIAANVSRRGAFTRRKATLLRVSVRQLRLRNTLAETCGESQRGPVTKIDKNLVSYVTSNTKLSNKRPLLKWKAKL